MLFELIQDMFEVALKGKTISGIELDPPRKKIENAFNRYGIPYGDKIFMLIDDTLFKSAKDGFAITTSGIYWHNSFGIESPKNGIKWSELGDCFVSTDKKKLLVGAYEFKNIISDCQPEIIIKILESILENWDKHIKQIGKNKEQQDDIDIIDTDSSKLKTNDENISYINMESVIQDIVYQLAPRYSSKGIDFSPELKKINAAYQNYGVPQGKKIFALIDATVLGSAKNGLAVTSYGIYWHNSSMKNYSRNHLSWQELQNCKMDKGWMSVQFSMYGEFDISDADVKAITLLEFLENILQELETINQGSSDINIINYKNDINVNDVPSNVRNSTPDNGLKKFLELKQHIKTNAYFRKIRADIENNKIDVKKIRFLDHINKGIGFVLSPTDIGTYAASKRDADVDADTYREILNYAGEVLDSALEFRKKFHEEFGVSENELFEYSLDNEIITFLYICYHYSVVIKHFRNDTNALNFLKIVFENMILNKYAAERIASGDVTAQEFSTGAKKIIERSMLDDDLFLIQFQMSFQQNLSECLSFVPVSSYFDSPISEDSIRKFFIEHTNMIKSLGILLFM